MRLFSYFTNFIYKSHAIVSFKGHLHIMKLFIRVIISEKTILDNTKIGGNYWMGFIIKNAVLLTMSNENC